MVNEIFTVQSWSYNVNIGIINICKIEDFTQVILHDATIYYTLKSNI